jgi:dihydrolipoamide dehydrogenase
MTGTTIVLVDDHMRTGVPHLYAIGDIVPGYALAHVASHEAILAVETIAGLDTEPFRMDLMPRVTFCRPEIASVGLSEADAAQQGLAVKVGSFPFRALGKATIVGEVDGFAKFVAEAQKAKLDLNPADGAELERNVKEVFNLEPPLVGKLKEILK